MAILGEHISMMDLIDALDACPLDASDRAAIAYHLLKKSRINNDLINSIMVEFENGFKDNNIKSNLIAKFIKENPTSHNYMSGNSMGLAWGVFPNIDVLDGILGEYYISWAKGIGLSESEITDVFCSYLNPSQ